jgi:hypothetical protein
MNRGKIIILLILAVAVGVSFYGIWFRHRQMRRVLESFSAPVAQLIAYAPEAELLMLGSPNPGAIDPIAEYEETRIGDRKYPVVNKKSVASIKGFGKLRADLVRDSSYNWNQANNTSEAAANWQFVLVLADGKDRAQLALSPDSCQIMLLDAGPVLSIAPICEPMKELLAEQFAAATK